MNAPEQIPALDGGPIAAYSPVAAGLAELRHRFEGVVFDVTTTKGDKEARGFRKELVTLRTTLEAKRKELKAPALAYAKRIDDEAKAINGEILALEEPLDAQIKAEEERKEAERAARAEAERKRIDLHQRSLHEIRDHINVSAGGSAASIELAIREVEQYEIGPAWEEFQGQAQVAKDETLDKLREMHAAAVAREQEEARQKAEREAEAARLAQERAELERQRQEQEAAARAERERIAAEQRAEAERLAAARAAQEAELRAQREAQERELAEQRAQQAKAEAEARAIREAEEQRLAAERAELRRQQEEAEARAREERRKADEAQARIERAAPALLKALRMVKASSKWSALESEIQEAVERAIKEAGVQP